MRSGRTRHSGRLFSRLLATGSGLTEEARRSRSAAPAGATSDPTSAACQIVGDAAHWRAAEATRQISTTTSARCRPRSGIAERELLIGCPYAIIAARPRQSPARAAESQAFRPPDDTQAEFLGRRSARKPVGDKHTNYLVAPVPAAQPEAYLGGRGRDRPSPARVKRSRAFEELPDVLHPARPSLSARRASCRHMSKETLEFHHDKHTRYVNKRKQRPQGHDGKASRWKRSSRAPTARTRPCSTMPASTTTTSTSGNG